MKNYFGSTLMVQTLIQKLAFKLCLMKITPKLKLQYLTNIIHNKSREITIVVMERNIHRNKIQLHKKKRSLAQTNHIHKTKPHKILQRGCKKKNCKHFYNTRSVTSNKFFLKYVLYKTINLDFKHCLCHINALYLYTKNNIQQIATSCNSNVD